MVVVFVVRVTLSLVNVSDNEVTLELDVAVSVVQKLHVASHMPAYGPTQVGQKSVSHALAMQPPPWPWTEVRHWDWLQKSKPAMSIWRHGLTLDTDVVVVALVVVRETVVAEVEEIVVKVTDVNVPVWLVSVPVVTVCVSDVVMFSAQIPHVVSHRCGLEPKGPNCVKQSPSALTCSHVSKQSSYLKQVVTVDVVLPLWVVQV
jgi:hypothetical protein